MVAAGSVVDPVSAYQQWQVGVALRADAFQGMQGAEGRPRVGRAAANRASTEPATETPSVATEATLEAWEHLHDERVEWVGVRERFAALTTDAALNAKERHEARLGFALAAVMSGEHRAAAMAARRVDVGAGLVTLDANVARHLDAAREAMDSIGDSDREVLLRALGMLGAPNPGGSALHADRTNVDGRQS